MFAGEGALEAEGQSGLTAYELERIARIRRNQEIMKRLGLGDHDIVSAAMQRCGRLHAGGGGGGGPKRGDPSSPDGAGAGADRRKKRKLNGRGEGDTSGGGEGGGIVRQATTRRSRRLAGMNGDESAAATQGDDSERRRGFAVELDGAHEAEAEAYRLRNAGRQERVSVVGTASYQHTLMRVRTMGEEALARRVKAIERAKGKHAVVKMRLFARVLFLEGHEGLSVEATESLERLVEELGDPEADEDADGDAGA